MPKSGASIVSMQSPTRRPAASAIPPGSMLLTRGGGFWPGNKTASATVSPKDCPFCTRTRVTRTGPGKGSPSTVADAARLAKDGVATKDGSATGVEDVAARSVKDGAATASRHGAIAMRSRSLSIIRHVRWLSPAGCTRWPSAGALGLGFPLGLGATAAAAAPEAPATFRRAPIQTAATTLEIDFAVPELGPGTYIVSAVGANFTLECSPDADGFGVLAGATGDTSGSGGDGDGSLAFTGLDLLLLLLVALALILAGRYAVRMARQRREANSY